MEAEWKQKVICLIASDIRTIRSRLLITRVLNTTAPAAQTGVALSQNGLPSILPTYHCIIGSPVRPVPPRSDRPSGGGDERRRRHSHNGLDLAHASDRRPPGRGRGGEGVEEERNFL